MLENVANLQRHDRGRTFKTVMNMLELELGYTVYTKILNAKDYGVPQNRPRIFLVGFRDPINFKFPEKADNVPKLKDILEHDVDPSFYISQLYLNGLKKHRERHEKKGHGFGYQVLDPEGVAKALVIGGMGHERNLVKDKLPLNAYSGPDDDLKKPNSEGLRRLTPRECARLQGFPDSFKFPVCKTQTWRQLAEAVAVPLIEKIALNMKESMKKKEPLRPETLVAYLNNNAR